jgi:hypothetical protein
VEQGAHLVVVELPGPSDLKAAVGEGLGLDPVVARDRDQGALGQGGRGGRQGADVGGDLGRVGQDGVGAVGLAGQDVGDALQEQGGRRPGAARGQPGHGGLGVGAHLVHAMAAQQRPQQRRPGLHRAGMREPIRGQPALGGGGPALDVVRLAGQHLQERSLGGDQRMLFDQPALLEPLEPPAGGLGASAGVGGEARLSTSLATRSASPAAWAWSMASSGRPLASHQAAARAWSCWISSGSRRSSSAPSRSWNRWW